MTPVYIALGSNLQDPIVQLRSAVIAVGKLPHSRLERTSGVYRSTAIGPGTQPDYLNAVLLLSTDLLPLQVLDALQKIEQAQGRMRNVRWGARTLDLDILLFGDQQIDSSRLTVPHSAMAHRNFVLYPLAEISSPDLVLPDGTVLDTLVTACPRGELEQTQLQLPHNQRP